MSMSISTLPDALLFGSARDPLRIEFHRRIGHFSMDTNHYHSASEIYYLFSGERNYFIKDRTYPIRPGDLVLIGSDQVHKTSDVGIPNHERLVIYYESPFFAPYSADEQGLLMSPFSRENPVLSLNLQEQSLMENLLYSILKELEEEPPGYQIHLRHVAAELLLSTARLSRRQDGLQPYKSSPVQKKITDIVRHINSHYGEALDLEGLSRQFYISGSHLSRMFKEETGFNLTEYVNITRIKEAQRLLRETDLSITRVSEVTGFDNFSHFGKVFKKMTGMSPRTYRSMYPAIHNK